MALPKTSTRTSKQEKMSNMDARRKTLDKDTLKLIKVLESNKPYHQKLKHVKNELQESVREINFNYSIKGFLEDAAYALHRAVEESQGFTKMKSESKPSGGENPPEMLDVKFADGRRIKVPYGVINLPALGKNAYIEMNYYGNQNLMQVSGTCEKRYAELMDDIMARVEEILDTDSIYKNQALKYHGSGSPEFMDLTGMDDIQLFLTAGAQFATEPIEARIEKCEECLDKGIDLKFGALLEGDYGTGKTLYASKLALKAIRNGWTFFYCPTPESALSVLRVANMFTNNGKGVVLFIEDIDKVLKDRNKMTNEISLLMDGSETKHNNIISIFSTNHLENIDPTFLRGKRIGSIVTLAHLDAETATRMFTYYLGEAMPGCDFKASSAKVEEYKIVPAFVSEIIDRVKTRGILRKDGKVTEDDVLNAIEQYKRQMDIARVKTSHKTPLEEAHDLDKAKFVKFLEDSPIIKDMSRRIKDNL